MGYEHKLYIVDGLSDGYNSIIAEVDISRHDIFSEHLEELFPDKLNGYIYIDDEKCTKDYYGTELTCTKDIRKLANWLEQDNDQEYYRRLPHVIAMLRAFNPKEWNDLKVVHFGH